MVEHKLTRFDDAGIQMEIPIGAPFVSSSPTGVLIMLHRINRGLRAEAGYIVTLHVQRFGKASMDDRLEFASQATSDFQQWRYKMHSRLNTRRESGLIYVRKDMETPAGEFLCVDVEIFETESVERDLADVERMIESIKIEK